MEHYLQALEPFMFGNSLNNIIPIMDIPMKAVHANEAYFTPKEKDELFWCYYVMKFGIQEYMYLRGNMFIAEKNIKIAAAEQIGKLPYTNFKKIVIKTKTSVKDQTSVKEQTSKKNQTSVKNQKKLKTYKDIQQELVYADKISIETFLLLCQINELNGCVVIPHKHVIRGSKETSDTYVMLIDGHYSLYKARLPHGQQQIPDWWQAPMDLSEILTYDQPALLNILALVDRRTKTSDQLSRDDMIDRIFSIVCH
jgi:hypothetical protein